MARQRDIPHKTQRQTKTWLHITSTTMPVLYWRGFYTLDMLAYHCVLRLLDHSLPLFMIRLAMKMKGYVFIVLIPTHFNPSSPLFSDWSIQNQSAEDKGVCVVLWGIWIMKWYTRVGLLCPIKNIQGLLCPIKNIQTYSGGFFMGRAPNSAKANKTKTLKALIFLKQNL